MDTLKILVVDDEARMRKLVSDFLTRSGYKTVEAADGEEALEKFFSDKEIALMRAQQEGILLTTAESLLFELTVDSRHPHFKEISALVK